MRTYRLSYYFFLILFLLVFNSCGTESTPIYNLTTSVNGEGTITPSSGEFEEGEVVTLTSSPNEGWTFQNWSGDGSGSSTSVSITMNSDKNVEGNFQRRDYPMTITIEGEGTVIEEIVSSPKTTEYPYETVVELTSQPDDWWVFYQWSGDFEGKDNPQTIKIDNEKEVTSEFRSIDDLLNIEKSGEGTVDITQESFDDNPSRKTVTLTPTPSNGYRFVEWSDWDGDVDENNKIEITLNEEKNVSVKFSPIVFLGENEITIMCPDGEVGDIGIVDGVEYEVVDRELLNQRIQEGRGSLNRKVCVSLVTDMSSLFENLSFNQSIGDWDVGNVTNMSSMFVNTPFNQPIGDWDVSNVTRMTRMFFDTVFDQPIGDWDVSNVTNMNRMFESTTFDQPIENWDVSNVTSMSYMFSRSEFNKPIGGWDVGNVTHMGFMFIQSQFNQPIGDWDVENVTNMNSMFRSSEFNQNISNWCVWRFGSEPSLFSEGSPLTEENKPRWGTCPD